MGSWDTLALCMRASNFCKVTGNKKKNKKVSIFMCTNERKFSLSLCVRACVRACVHVCVCVTPKTNYEAFAALKQKKKREKNQ